MTDHNAANERIKRQYFTYLAEALGHSEQSVAKAIARFEAYTKWRDFKKFHTEQAKGFKRSLADQRGKRSGEPLSKATLYATLTALRRFFIWLAGAAWLQVPHRVLGRRVLQPFGQGCADGERNPSSDARSDDGADSPCNTLHTRDYRRRTA